MRTPFPRLRALLVAGSLVLLFAAAHAQFFSDITENDHDARIIGDAAYHQLMEGFPDGKFAPDVPLRRAECVMVSARLLNISLKGFMVLPGSGPAEPRFPDVPEHHWMMRAASFLAERGMLPGEPGAPFAPQALVTRGEFLATLYRLFHGGTTIAADAAAHHFDDCSLLPAGWAGNLTAPLLRRDAAHLLEDILFYLTQHAVTEGTITRFEVDARGTRWVMLETPIGQARLNLPDRGVLISGGSQDDLREGTMIRTLSDAVTHDTGPFYRVRQVTIVQG